ncbi:MAG: polysaccharide pyruvyl transferase family protein [Lachnospiraceae bacterium]|nr:polysaccharide pyruvyl transferase family protein [Lachnospiraceae bacterium]
MRVGILTFHNAHNYGATLQAYALKKCVKEMGHDVQIVNYRNPKIEAQYPKILAPKFTLADCNPKRWKQFIYDTLRGIYGQKEWTKQWKAFDKFINKDLLENHTELIEAACISKLGLDACLLGSDQIWSSFLLGRLDEVYFGAFKTKEKIISYAASLPNGNIAEEEIEQFKTLTQNIDVVSVREEKLAEQLGRLTGRNVETTVDPTLLLEAKDYEILLPKEIEKKLPEQGYVFAYFVVEEQWVADCAKKVADELGLPIIELHYYHMPECSGENQYADFGPAEFLYYIKHATCVITNSFHGTVFSILYQRSFYSVYKKNGRVDNLLHFLQIPERHVENASEIRATDIINYEKVHEKLKDYRAESLQFLKDNLVER